MDANKQWMSSGKIGCAFAAYFAKRPNLCCWVTVVNPDTFYMPKDAMILSIQFPDKTKKQVFDWAISNGFYTEDLGNGNIGLRYKIGDKIAWVQYFGLDSHAKTRQAPIPELCLTVKMPLQSYAKVGINNVLHLAHACVSSLNKRAQDIMWNSSFTNTEKRLGHKPTLNEAAKTTYHE